MANFTATPLNGTLVVSILEPAVNNGLLTFELSGADQRGAPISGKLWENLESRMSGGQVVPATPTSNSSGVISVQVVASMRGVLYLVLHNDNTGADSDPVAITAEALKSVTIDASPKGIQHNPAPPITLTAYMVDIEDEAMPSNFRLVWAGERAEDKKYIESFPHMTWKGALDTFQTVTIWTRDDVKLLDGALQVVLNIGPDQAQVSVYQKVPVLV